MVTTVGHDHGDAGSARAEPGIAAVQESSDRVSLLVFDRGAAVVDDLFERA